MGTRAENEPLMKFWFRQYVEDPGKILGFSAIIALVFVYKDNQRSQEEYRADAKAQNAALIQQIETSTETLRQAVVQLKSMDNRLLHVERELELDRKTNK